MGTVNYADESGYLGTRPSKDNAVQKTVGAKDYLLYLEAKSISLRTKVHLSNSNQSCFVWYCGHWL